MHVVRGHEEVGCGAGATVAIFRITCHTREFKFRRFMIDEKLTNGDLCMHLGSDVVYLSHTEF